MIMKRVLESKWCLPVPRKDKTWEVNAKRNSGGVV